MEAPLTDDARASGIAAFRLTATCLAFALADFAQAPPGLDSWSAAVWALSRAGKFALLLIIIDKSGGFARFGLSKPGKTSIMWALAGFAALFAASFTLSYACSALTPGVVRRLPDRLEASAPFFIAQAASAFATGYYEETLYRAFFLSSALELGMPFAAAAAVSTAWFAYGHAWQGPHGVAFAVIAGLLLCAIWRKTRDAHALAFAHALYDLAAAAALAFA
jgi:membrane protease YdiL (CAAX protease family)